MCLHPRPVEPVPEETARVARAAFPNANPYMRMRDELGTIFEDGDFVGLFPERGKPAFSPWRLALVTIMQFSEDLSDRRAADAVRARIDWKYALSLELSDPGFDASILCEFRARLVEGGQERLLFDALLERFRAMGLVKRRGKQRTDSTHVLACTRNLDRLELVGEAMRRALNSLAVAAPGWLRKRARSEWERRYARPFDDRWLPKDKEERLEEAEGIGADGLELLGALSEEGTPAWLWELPAVETMRAVWLQNYLLTQGGEARWRSREDGLPPAAKRLGSPTDPEARGARRGEISWGGYKAHFTETCDAEGAPGLITDVETTPAPAQDSEAVAPTHETLAARNLLPAEHLVDGAYMDPQSLLEAHERFGVSLVGPAMRNTGWQAREGTGFDLSSFELDWEKREATCPEGKKNASWREASRDGKPIVRVKFSRKDCRPCPSRELCIRREKSTPFRELTVRSREHYEATRLARKLGLGPDRSRYAGRRREGIEGTIARAVKTCGARRARYVGIGKVHLQHLLGAAALNFLRVGEWLAGEPRAAPPRSPFRKLMTLPTAA